MDHFSNRCSYSRHLVGDNRDVAKELENSSPSNYYYSLFTDSGRISVAEHGNYNYLHSTDLLRKVKSQHLAKSRYDNDPWQDIIITKMSYASTIVGNHLNGYVQMLCHTPLMIHLYSEEQILLLKYLEKGCLTLHFDATGSVIRKLDQLQKKILYYALSVQHPEARVSPIPLAEMISSEQTNVEISNFLNRWLYDVKKITNKLIVPNHIEVDYSWAMLHSVCNSFWKETLENYFNTCWQYIQTHSSSTHSPKTIIHICTAHVMNRFSYKLGHNFQLDKQRKQKIMFIMARMVSCTVFDEMNQLFISLCMTSLSKNLYPEIQKYFDKLDNAISISSEEVNVDLEYLPELDEELPNSLGDGNTYRTRSPFGIHFQSELQNCMQVISRLESKKRVHNLETNLYFLPDFPKFLVTYYMPICPL